MFTKVRKFINTVNNTFGESFKPGKHVSIDEGMMSFNGRLSFKQYMPAKPVKHGIKFYALCDSITGYCLKLHIYSGYEERFVSGEGFTYNICNHLMSDYFNNNHVLYTDNYYTPIKLARKLLSLGTDLVGTIRKTSKEFPKFETCTIQPGESIKVSNSDGIIACRF